MVIAEAQIGWNYLEAGRWAAARSVFESAVHKEESAEALHGLGDSLWWSGEVQASIPYLQQAFNAYRETGNGMGAAVVAFTLAMTYKCCFGNIAAANGWVGRAETIVSEGGAAPMEGWLQSFRGYLAVDHDLEAAESLTLESLEFAKRTSDPDLDLVSRAMLGEIAVKRGRVEEGMRLIDEAMAGLSADAHTRKLTLVIVCCSMLLACHDAADLKRAQEWLRIAESFIEEYGCLYLFAECRVLYGATLFSEGLWARAEAELSTGIKVTDGIYDAINALARANQARLRIAQGRLEEAAELLQGIEQAWAAEPVLAALMLAQDRPTTALSVLDRYFRQIDRSSITATWALQLQAEAHIRSGEIDLAANLASELRDMAQEHEWSEVSARASMVEGHLAVAKGDQAAALRAFESAMSAFAQSRIVYESTCARLAAAEVLAETQPDLASIEAVGVLRVFERMGAQPGSDAASALLRRLGVPARPGPRMGGVLSRREEEVLRLISLGLSNPEIADRLVISRKTAAHHVSSLLAKLNLRNRAEAVAYAARAELARN